MPLRPWEQPGQLEEFGFSRRLSDLLARNGIWTIDELRSRSPEQLLSIRMLGEGSMREIEDVLAALDLVQDYRHGEGER